MAQPLTYQTNVPPETMQKMFGGAVVGDTWTAPQILNPMVLEPERFTYYRRRGNRAYFRNKRHKFSLEIPAVAFKTLVMGKEYKMRLRA